MGSRKGGRADLTISIRLRLVLAFNLFLAALALVGYFTYRQLDRSGELSGHISSDLVARVEHAAHLDQNLDLLRSLELAYILDDDLQQQEQARREMPTVLRNIDASAAEYQGTFAGRAPPADLLRFQQAYTAYLPKHEQMLALADGGRGQEALGVYGTTNTDYQAVTEIVHGLRHDAYEQAQAAAVEAGSHIGRGQYILIGGLAAAALLIFALGHPLSTNIHRRLQGLLEGIKRVSRGELDRPISADGRDELTALAEAFNTMMDSLSSARDEVTGLHRQALAMHEERIALLQERVSQVVKAQEEERQRVARELHDQAGQVLTALQLGLSRLEAEGPTPEVQAKAASLRQLALEAIHTVRILALDLRPSALDELGLSVALQDYIDTYSRRMGIPAKLEACGVPQRLPAGAEVTLFRIAQEGLTNVAKHAHASQVKVSLALDDRTLQLIVEDDGIGFDAERALGSEQQKSLGLLGIQERCHLLGGELQICSRPHEGTKLVVSVPLGANGLACKEGELAGLQ